MSRNWILFGVVTASALWACKNESATTSAPAPVPSATATAALKAPEPKPEEIEPETLANFKPLPASFESGDNALTEEKTSLGKALYYEKKLSISKTISCNSCHMLDAYGVDGHPVSEGHDHKPGGRNSPTSYNAAGHLAQFWDGRAKDVEAQAKGPILNPVEMGMPNEKAVVAVLKKEPTYVAAFKKAFPGEADPVTFDNVAKAIGAFERKLVTPSRWDKFLGGDKTALTQEEKKGFKTFLATGCTGCHNGMLLGGNSYQKLGAVVAWPKQTDQGRFEVTKQESDKMFFKVPSLRNVEKTAPYFHDGSVASLPEAVKAMAKHQLGRDLPESDVQSIVVFLKALTGEVPKDYIAAPPEKPEADATKGKKG